MRTLVFAHRGASGYAPENTLEAFHLAVELGADGVELDVHLTKDGELLVAHDEKIDRVSDGKGFIADMTLAEIRRYTFNVLHPEYRDARAPTLGEVFELLRPTGLQVNVELKNSLKPYMGMEEKVIALAEKAGMSERILYSSFNHHSLLKVKQLDPHALCGLLYACCMVRPWDYARGIGVDAIHPHFSELSFVDDECERAHRIGIKVNAWTVNGERDMKRVSEAGADALITNYPDRARACVG